MHPDIAIQVRRRAQDCCEYCRVVQANFPPRHQIEHIVPRKHGGESSLSNLALACIACNLHKGTNLTGIDPQNGEITPLFNPRQHRWKDHFCWRGALLVGTTAIGRTTIQVLEINRPNRVQFREELLREVGFRFHE